MDKITLQSIRAAWNRAFNHELKMAGLNPDANAALVRLRAGFLASLDRMEELSGKVSTGKTDLVKQLDQAIQEAFWKALDQSAGRKSREQAYAEFVALYQPRLFSDLL